MEIGYNITLFLHSWVRWAAVVVGLIVMVQSIAGWLGNKAYGKSNNALSASFSGLFALQLILGLLLWGVLSPRGLKAMQSGDSAAIMADPTARYWAATHMSFMIVAVIIVQIGRVVSKKASVDKKKFMLQAIFYGIGLLIVFIQVQIWQNPHLFQGL